MLKSIERRKNEAAYQVRRSAVKNVHVAKRGIDITNEAIPAKTAHLGFDRQIKNKNSKINKKSWIFI